MTFKETDYSVEMKWPIKHCEFKDDKFIEVEMPEKRFYNPFAKDLYNDESRLYLKFIAIKEKDPTSIADFINTYGFLGLNIKSELEEINGIIRDMYSKLRKLKLGGDTETFIKYMENILCFKFMPFEEQISLLSSAHNDFIDYKNSEYCESLVDFSSEIIRMRTIVILNKAILDEDKEVLKSGIGILQKLKLVDDSQKLFSPIDYEFEAEHINFFKANGLSYMENDSIRNLQYFAMLYIKYTINKFLIYVNPNMETSYNNYLVGEDHFKGNWKALNLISAMYVMLYKDLINGKIMRKCARGNCSSWFPVDSVDDRKIYCDVGCAKAQAQKEYRKRLKNKKEGE